MSSGFACHDQQVRGGAEDRGLPLGPLDELEQNGPLVRIGQAPAVVSRAAGHVGRRLAERADARGGEVHPGLVSLDRFDLIDGMTTRSAREVFHYQQGWGLPTEEEREIIREIMRGGPPAPGRAQKAA